MAGEVSPPERDSAPESHLFNVDMMNDDQIVVLGRGLWALEEAEYQDDDSLDSLTIGESMHEQLTREVRELALRDPERIKALVQRLEASSEDSDQEIAARAVPELVSFDYELTRD